MDLEVKYERDLLGIRYWMFVNLTATPWFRVYNYLGYDDITEPIPESAKNLTIRFYFFQCRATATVIAREWSELYTPEFRPFLMDAEKIAPYYYGEKKILDKKD